MKRKNRPGLILYLLKGIVLLLLINPVSILSQEDFSNSDEQGVLSFDFKSSYFIKNNEYFGDFTKGFTGIGYFMQPKLRYDFGNGSYLYTGIHLLQYAGRESFNQFIPIFRLSIPFSESIKINAGHIEGTLAHKLSEPMFRFDSWYRDNIEYGIQILTDFENWKADLWIDWEQFIEPGDDFKEIFTAGLTSSATLYKRDQLTLSWPVECLIRHFGGQIDVSPDPVINFINASTGISLKYMLKPSTNISIEGRYYIYGSNDKSLPFKSGSAFYLTSKFSYNHIEAFLGFWQADGWISAKGESLFQSVSDFNPMNIEKTRKLLNSKLIYTKSITEGIHFEIGMETYFDMINKQFDYSSRVIFRANIFKSLLKIPSDS